MNWSKGWNTFRYLAGLVGLIFVGLFLTGGIATHVGRAWGEDVGDFTGFIFFAFWICLLFAYFDAIT